MPRFVFVGLLMALAWPALADVPLTVEIITARKVPTHIVYSITGTMEPTDDVAIGARSGGRIVSIEVEVGDIIKAGQLLGVFDSTQAQAAVQAGMAQLAAAEAAVVQAQQAMDRAASLTKRGVGTQADLDVATEALLAAQANSRQAEAQLATAKQGLEDTEIHAKFAGIITERSAEPGQVVDGAQTILRMARDGAQKAVFYAPDGVDLSPLLGRQITLRTLDPPLLEIAAEIREIAPLANPENGTVKVTAIPQNTGTLTGFGAAVSGEITVQRAPAFQLPATAIVSAKGGAAVWVVDPQTNAVSLSPVAVVRYTSNLIEVSDGISDGTQVVGAGSHLLFPGRKVASAGKSE